LGQGIKDGIVTPAVPTPHRSLHHIVSEGTVALLLKSIVMGLAASSDQIVYEIEEADSKDNKHKAAKHLKGLEQPG
jgi:hypothetical protein